MATQTVWVNPSDSNDKIIFNDDAAAAASYRFLINTGFECTITRDQTNSRTIVSISGGTYAGILELNGNGEVWSKGDLTLRLDSDGGGTNKLIVNGSGVSAVEISEGGRVAIKDNFGYLTARSRSKIISASSAQDWLRSDVVTSRVIWYSGNPSGAVGFNDYLRALDLVNANAQAIIPLNLPDGATVTNWTMQYRKTVQAGGKQRSLNAQLLRHPQFSTVNTGQAALGSLQVASGEGTTGNATKTQALSPSFQIDAVQYSYSIGVFFLNDDTGNDGADGLGVAAFKVDYTLSDLKF